MSLDYNPNMTLDEANEIYEIKQQALNDFMKRGFVLPELPSYTDEQGIQRIYQGQVPADLTDLSDKELGSYLSMLNAWMSYAGMQKTLADMSRSEAKQKMETTESMIRLSHKTDSEGKRLSNPERDDLVRQDRRVATARSAYMYLEFLYQMMAQTYKNAEQCYAAISRRITQRGQEIDRDNRTTTVHSMPRPGHPLSPPSPRPSSPARPPSPAPPASCPSR